VSTEDQTTATDADAAPNRAGATESTPDGGERTPIREVLERAVTDPEFGQLLLDDPDAALAGYDLTDVQILLLHSLDEDDLAKLTPENLDEHFAVEAAVYTPEDAQTTQQGYEQYDRDDIDG
jgi:hypothetical protein